MLKKYSMYLFTVLLMLFMLGQIPVLAKPQANQSKVDQAIATLIENYIAGKELSQENNINVAVANKTISLSGTVTTLEVSTNVEDYARSIAESYNIDNRLKLAGVAVSDVKITDAVLKKLHKYAFYTVYDWVTVEVKDGVVTLNGWAYLPWGPRYFAKQAEKVKGVNKIINKIQLAQGSDDIRYNAARAIYTDPLLEWLSYEHNPPIHIIVLGNRVILEGTVDSEQEKSLASDDVLWNTNALNITNNLVISKSAS